MIGQRNVIFDTVRKGQARGHGTPDFDAQSRRGIRKKDFQSTVAGPPSCTSVALRRRLENYEMNEMTLPSDTGFKIRSEAEITTSRSRMLPTILHLYE